MPISQRQEICVSYACKRRCLCTLCLMLKCPISHRTACSSLSSPPPLDFGHLPQGLPVLDGPSPLLAWTVSYLLRSSSVVTTSEKQFFLFSCSVAQCCPTLCSWSAARQASLSITNSQSLLNLISIESMVPSSHLILCRPLLLLPLVFPSVRVFSNESALHNGGQTIGAQHQSF